jgi:hypothetical protein
LSVQCCGEFIKLAQPFCVFWSFGMHRGYRRPKAQALKVFGCTLRT